jgi:hypothetical protein
MHDVFHDAVAAARDLSPHIRAVRDELEAMRRLPPALAEALARAGLLQLYLDCVNDRLTVRVSILPDSQSLLAHPQGRGSLSL